MSVLTIPLAVIFAAWATRSLITGKVHVRWKANWWSDADYGEFSRRHNPLQFWIAVVVLYLFSLFCIVITVVAYFMDMVW